MNHRIFALLGSVLAMTGLFIVAPIAAYAQQQQGVAEAQSGGLEEIVVTAQRREERAVDVPITITALSNAAAGDRQCPKPEPTSRSSPRRFGSTTSRPSSSRRSAESAPASRPRAAARTSASTSTAFIHPTRSRPTSSCPTSRASKSSRARRAHCSATTPRAARSSFRPPTPALSHMPRGVCPMPGLTPKSIRPMRRGAPGSWPWISREPIRTSNSFSGISSPA